MGQYATPQLKAAATYYAEMAGSYATRVERDAEGNVVWLYRYDSKGRLSYAHESTWENGRIIRKTSYDGSGHETASFPYTYDERTNMLNSDGLGYMQLTKLSSTKMCIVEKFYEDGYHVFFAETTYERILPFDMYEYWNNFKPLNP